MPDYLVITEHPDGPRTHRYYGIAPTVLDHPNTGRRLTSGLLIIYGPAPIPPQYEHLPLNVLRDIAMGRKPKVKI